MKQLWLLLMIISLVAGTALVAVADHHQGPEEVIFETTIGTISFLHIKHQGKISDCSECHHKGIAEGKCTGCHGADKDIPKLTKAFHGQCKGCHRNSSGPTNCKGCHTKH